ncbi:hypothetical protein E2C01_029455 [Portunus trituberculatus]|uniref:Uncharacterized protein n=1 Tax=Portunus trituberculatus TaxID=210409 RepID=A0A5B7EPE6_PORTR|nr:hypothetical protein [Portunus trituberculatus]
MSHQRKQISNTIIPMAALIPCIFSSAPTTTSNLGLTSPSSRSRASQRLAMKRVLLCVCRSLTLMKASCQDDMPSSPELSCHTLRYCRSPSGLVTHTYKERVSDMKIMYKYVAGKEKTNITHFVVP